MSRKYSTIIFEKKRVKVAFCRNIHGEVRLRGSKARLLQSEDIGRGVDDTGGRGVDFGHFVIFAEDVSKNGTGQVFCLGGQGRSDGDIVFGYGDDSAFLLFGTADVDAVGEVQERMDFLRSDRRIQFDTDAVRTGNSIRGEG